MRTAWLYSILLLILASGVLVLANSCKKDNDGGGTYYIRFFANGEKVEFKEELHLIAELAFTTNVYTAQITALDEPADMSLQLYSSQEIKPGTYSGFNYVAGNLTGCVIGYSPDGTTIYISETELEDDPTITITDMDDSVIKGTFQGLLKSAGKPDLEVTEGEFFVKLSE